MTYPTRSGWSASMQSQAWFVDHDDWIRIKFDLKPLVRHVRDERFLHSKVQHGSLS